MSELDKNQLADALDVSPRTVRRWANDEGCPHWREGGKLRFDLEAVRAWRRTSGATANDSPATFASKANLASAELARRITAAKKNELELSAERGLKELGIADTIRAAKTFEELARISQEVSALVSSGDLSPTRGRAIKVLLAETRQGLKAAETSTAGDEAARPVLLCSKRAYLLAKVYDRIVSDEIREGVTKFIDSEARRDLKENPNRTRVEVHGEDAAGETAGDTP